MAQTQGGPIYDADNRRELLAQELQRRGANRRRYSLLSGHQEFPLPPTPERRTPHISRCMAGCTARQLGLGTIAGAAAVRAGQPRLEKEKGPLGKASEKTSYVSHAARQFLGERKLPFGLKLPAPTDTTLRYGRTLAAKFPMTRYAGKFVGRATPYVGWGLLANDVAQIARCTADCKRPFQSE